MYTEDITKSGMAWPLILSRGRHEGRRGVHQWWFLPFPAPLHSSLPLGHLPPPFFLGHCHPSPILGEEKAKKRLAARLVGKEVSDFE